MNADETRQEAADILRTLIDEIVLVPEDGELRIDLKGDLARILALAQGKKKPVIREDDGLPQIKMVAGEGLEPPTHGL